LCYTDGSNFPVCLDSSGHSPKTVVTIDRMRLTEIVVAFALVLASSAEPIPRAVKAPKVDLGYAVYEGSYNANTSINIFKG
jgi:hypothetical protein